MPFDSKTTPVMHSSHLERPIRTEYTKHAAQKETQTMRAQNPTNSLTASLTRVRGVGRMASPRLGE